MRPWSCKNCSTVLGFIVRDGPHERLRPEPNVGIRWLVVNQWLDVICPSCHEKRTWRGDLDRPVSHFEQRAIVVNS